MRSSLRKAVMLKQLQGRPWSDPPLLAAEVRSGQHDRICCGGSQSRLVSQEGDLVDEGRAGCTREMRPRPRGVLGAVECGGVPRWARLESGPQASQPCAASLLMEIKSCYLNGYSLALFVCQTRWHGDRSWQEPRRSSTNCGGSVSVSVFSSLYEIRKRINLFLKMKLFQKCDGGPRECLYVLGIMFSYCFASNVSVPFGDKVQIDVCSNISGSF